MEKNCKTCGGTGWVMRPSIPTSCPEGCEPKMYPADTVASQGDLHQCPYDKATRCNLKEPCLGCEIWAASRASVAEKPMTAEEAQRCPVCGGKGLVPNGFYNMVTGIGSTTSITPETCRSCNGTGIVFPYASLKPTVEVSDGEIEYYLLDSPDYIGLEFIDEGIQAGFRSGAKWMRELMKERNK